MNIVGIMGVAGSGKSTAACALVEYGYVEVSLADPMKRAAAEWLGWGSGRLWGPSERRNEVDPKFQLSPRKFLQYLGTELGRECYQDIWVDYALRVARRILTEDDVVYHRTHGVVRIDDFEEWRSLADRDQRRAPGVVIPDVRFRNEVAAIRDAGGQVFRIVRPGAGLTGETAAHASEVQQFGIADAELDAVIVNDGTVDDLRRKVVEALEQARAA